MFVAFLLLVVALSATSSPLWFFLLGRASDSLVSPCYVFGWLSSSLGVLYLCCELCFLLMKYMLRHVLKKSVSMFYLC
jgi:hypothetical protein